MHHLASRLADVRSRSRRLLWTYGVGITTAAVLGAALVLGAADYCVRFDDLGLRVIASLAFLAVVVLSAGRFLVRPLTLPLTDVELARRIERQYPELQDRLRSAVEFVDQPEDDPRAGSPTLRRAVIVEAVAETERIDFQSILDPRPAYRAAAIGASVAILLAIVVAVHPWASRVAAARLVNPFTGVTWPKETQLVLSHLVDRVARGGTFEVEFVAAQGTRLPETARVDYRIDNADGSRTAATDALRPLGDSIIVRRENVERSFEYRVEGGDDRSMPWHRVEVIEPPRVAAVAAKLEPPPYTGLAAEKVAGTFCRNGPSGASHKRCLPPFPQPETTDGAIRAVEGTHVAIEATSTKPLRSATLHWNDEVIATRLEDQGRRVVAPAADTRLVVERSGSFWFELVDIDGIAGGLDQRFEIRAIADAPPTVVLESPAANLFVTPEASVPLRMSAKDDLAVREVRLVFSRSDRAKQPSESAEADGSNAVAEESLMLWRDPGADAGRPEPDREVGNDHRIVEDRWELGPLGLSPGVDVTSAAVADDYRPQSTRSQPRRLSIVTPEELQDRLSARQAAVIAELERVLGLERGCRQEVEGVAARVARLPAAEQIDIDRMQAAELGQRQVERSLVDRGEGVVTHANAILTDLENNKIDNVDIARRMQSLVAKIERLGRESLPLVTPALVGAVKAAQLGLESPQAADSRAVTEGLTTAAAHQDTIIASLEEMLAELYRWDSYRRFHREMSQLLREQEDVGRRTSLVGRHTLSRAREELTPTELADLGVLSGRQFDAARRLERLLGDMQQAAEPLEETEPLAADLLLEAFDEGRRMGTTGKMRTAADDVRDNQIGRALVAQQEIAANLQELLDILANRRQQELDRLVRKLEQAETDLANLERQQAALSPRLPNAAAAALGHLANEQRQLEQLTQRLARRLERLTAGRAGRSAQSAAGAMGAAGKAAAAGQGGEAAKQADDAQQALAEARRQLAAERHRAEAELAAAHMAKLGDAISHLESQQKKAIDENERLDSLRQTQNHLTRAQAISLADLAKLQRSLETETTAMADKLRGANAFRFALSAAARDMREAAGRLERRATDALTREAQTRALGRLALVRRALEPDKPNAKGDGAGGGQGGGQDAGQGQPGGGMLMLAELKMLQALQVEIHDRTATIQRTMTDGAASPEQRQELAALATEQTQLSELVLDMLESTNAPEGEGP